MSELNLDVREVKDGIIEIKAVGRIEAGTYEIMESAIKERFAGGCYNLITNLAEVDYISSAGCGVFLGAVDTIEEHSGKMVLLNPSKEVQDVFEVLGLSEIFSYASSIDEALNCFA